jgi:hypothetical protein
MFKVKKYNSFTQSRNDKFTFSGSGLAKDTLRLAKAKATMKPRFPGEAHAPQITPDGSIKPGEYIGPGTQIIKRAKLLSQGDKAVQPVSVVDKVAEIHDIDYQLASDSKTKAEQLQKVRQADLNMLKRLKQIKKKKLDKKANILLGEKGIGAKVGIEKQGKSLGTALGFAMGGPAGALIGRLVGKKGQNKLKDIAGPLEQMDLPTKNLLNSTKQKAIQDLQYMGVGSGYLNKLKNN